MCTFALAEFIFWRLQNMGLTGVYASHGMTRTDHDENKSSPSLCLPECA